MIYDEYQPPEGWYKHHQRKKRFKGFKYAFFFFIAYAALSTVIHYMEF